MKELFRGLLSDSKFYKNLLKVALPIIIQNFIASSLNLIDTIIVGRLGETEIASVGIANQFMVLFNIIAFGMFSGSGIFISQFWGKRDIKNIRKILGVSLVAGVTLSVIFTTIALIIPHKIIAIFNTDPNVIRLGSKFLRIACLSYVFSAVTFSFAMTSRFIEKAFISMSVSAVALLSNTLLNYVFVFGKFGAPALGVNGSALATVIARIIEMIIMVTYIYKTNNILAVKFSDFIDISKSFIIRLFKTIIPVVLNEACWGLGIVVYSVAYGRIGTQAMASVQISNTIQNLFMVLIFGVASSATVMIGKKIGAGDEEAGKLYARRFAMLGAVVGIVLGLILWISAPGILSFFKVSESVSHDSLLILYISAVVLVIKMFNIILIVGILRGGGDTKFSFIAEALTMWGIGVPLAFIGTLFLKLPVYLVFAMVAVEEIVKCIIGIWRLISNRWVRNVTHNM